MFLVNSRHPRFIILVIRRELLIPKLQSHFAEFLSEGFLAPLSILYLFTCGSFGTDCIILNYNSFSWSKRPSLFKNIIEYRNINLLPIDYAVKPYLRF